MLLGQLGSKGIIGGMLTELLWSSIMRGVLTKFFLLLAAIFGVGDTAHSALVFDVTLRGIASVAECRQSDPDYPICPKFRGYYEFTSQIRGPGNPPGSPSLNVGVGNGSISGSWWPPFSTMYFNFNFSDMGLGQLGPGSYELYGSGVIRYDFGRADWTTMTGYIQTARLEVIEVPDSFPFVQNPNFSFTTGAAVPESSIWAMMIAGFSMVGGFLRRRGKLTQRGLAA